MGPPPLFFPLRTHYESQDKEAGTPLKWDFSCQNALLLFPFRIENTITTKTYYLHVYNSYR